MDVARIIEILEDSIGRVDDQIEPLEGTRMVELYNVTVPIETRKVEQYATEMTTLLREWPETSYGQPVPRLGEELNYITAGAVLGEQRYAFTLFAFGLTLDWWDLLDPYTMFHLEKDDEVGKFMAGMGLISVSGYRPNVTAK